ncbi:uncharacterized protein LOC135488534 [Lineus longissimus]|uniref:uncharacterized protein LOC135488534 n=1 Tax=Lineus longissimus TaxID=88925 RepID=UPI00315C6C44
MDHVIRGPGPTAVQSKLGYLLSGPIYKESHESNTTILHIATNILDEKTKLQEYWDLETIGIKDDPSDLCKSMDFESYCETHLRFEDNGYIARLPWKAEYPPLPTNYDVCVRRTRNMIRKLSPDLRKMYNDIIQDQTRRDFIEEVPIDDVACGHYLPHRPVKKDSATTPIRIVYDCSCKVGEGASLNDCLETGPPLQNDLAAILVRFRLHHYALATDIEKAFLNVGLDAEDRKFTKFLWLTDSNDPNSAFKVYQFKVVLFGAVCSPFILNATVRSHLDKHESPVATDMKDNIYVDNVASGAESTHDTVKYYQESRKVMKSGGFNLRAWSSNCPELRKLAEADNVYNPDRIANVLGLDWDTEQDILRYSKRKIEPSIDNLVTKREVVQVTSSIYDPPGLLSPVHVMAKIFIQELWTHKLDWDEPLPDELNHTWRRLSQELSTVTQSCAIDRKYFDCQNTSNDLYKLHVFADASPKAYGAVAYLKCGGCTSLVMAKTRVAPIKPISLPRLELMAALIGSRLLNYLHRNLKPLINIEHAFLWSDSQIVLHWIHSEKKLPSFVENRVREIRACQVITRFKYCPTKDNPADILTRGMNASDLQNAILWWNGPHWLRTSEWPQCELFDGKSHTMDTDNADRDPVVIVTNAVGEPDVDMRITNVIDPERYSSYTKLLRISALVLRFVANAKKNPQLQNVGPLTAGEIQDAETMWIKHVQRQSYGDEIKTLMSKRRTAGPLVKQLRLFLDNDGILRAGGRLHNAPIDYGTKFPILIPSRHRSEQNDF